MWKCNAVNCNRNEKGLCKRKKLDAICKAIGGQEKIEPTVVIFRRWRSGDKEVVAIFPEIPNSEPYHCLSYEHIGQHGGCDPQFLIYHKTRLARENEKDVQELKKELESLGYNLVIRQRLTQKHLENRRKAL